jgi:hypothetical protein
MPLYDNLNFLVAILYNLYILLLITGGLKPVYSDDVEAGGSFQNTHFFVVASKFLYMNRMRLGDQPSHPRHCFSFQLSDRLSTPSNPTPVEPSRLVWNAWHRGSSSPRIFS